MLSTLIAISLLAPAKAQNIPIWLFIYSLSTTKPHKGAMYFTRCFSIAFCNLLKITMEKQCEQIAMHPAVSDVSLLEKLEKFVGWCKIYQSIGKEIGITLATMLRVLVRNFSQCFRLSPVEDTSLLCSVYAISSH